MNTTEKKKVLFLITKSNWGGAQRYVYDLATNLDRDRFAVAVALGGDGELVSRLQNAQVHVLPIAGLQRDISLKKELLSFGALWRILGAERPDILHVNSSKAGAVGAVIGRLRGVPRIVFTAHGWAFNEDRPWWQRLIFKAVHWLTVRLCHETIAVSEAIKTQLNWPGVATRMTVIPLGIGPVAALDRIAARHELAIAAKTAPSPNELWLGTIAELHPVKRHRDAIEAVAALAPHLPNLHYYIVGGGQLREELVAYVAELNLTDRIHFTGARPEAARLMSAFDIFVLPSASEAAGYALLEAGLAKRPVVATRVGGIPELITHGSNGLLVPSHDPFTLHRAINTLALDAATREQFGTALYKTVAHEHTITAMVDRTAARYSV